MRQFIYVSDHTAITVAPKELFTAKFIIASDFNMKLIREHNKTWKLLKNSCNHLSLHP